MVQHNMKHCQLKRRPPSACSRDRTTNRSPLRWKETSNTVTCQSQKQVVACYVECFSTEYRECTPPSRCAAGDRSSSLNVPSTNAWCISAVERIPTSCGNQQSKTKQNLKGQRKPVYIGGVRVE